MKTRILSLLAGLLSILPAPAREFRPIRAAFQIPTRYPALSPFTGRVVLVHGFLETGGNFNTLRMRLQKQGYECLVPRLRPSDGRGGLEGLAEGLKRDIDGAFGPEEPVAIIAFSMGGLVSRHYLQQLGGASRCVQLITVSSPHHGTRAAWCYPTKGAEQMRPGSAFLAKLAESDAILGEMPVTSYHTPMDLIILPPASSVWSRAENLSFPVLLHPLMLSSGSVLRDIESRLAEQARR
jgi:triacylglycerol lipase